VRVYSAGVLAERDDGVHSLMPSPALAGNPDDCNRQKVGKREKDMGLPQGFSPTTFPNGRKCFLGPDGKKINSLREVIRRNPEYYAERAIDHDKGESSDDCGSPALSPEALSSHLPGFAGNAARTSGCPKAREQGSAPRRTRMGARKIKAGAHGISAESGKIGRSRKSKVIKGSRRRPSVSGDRLSRKRNPRAKKSPAERGESVRCGSMKYESPEEDQGEARSRSVNMNQKRLRPRGSSAGTRKPVARRPKKELEGIPKRRENTSKKGQRDRFDDGPGIGLRIAVTPPVESNSNASMVTLKMDKHQRRRRTTKGTPSEKHSSAEEAPSASTASPPPLLHSPADFHDYNASLDIHAKRMMKKQGQGRSARLLSVPPPSGSGVGAKVSRFAAVSSGRKSPQAGVRAGGVGRMTSKSASRSSRSRSSRRSSLLSASRSSGPPGNKKIKKATKKKKLESLNEARNQIMTTHVSVDETNWIVEARLGISQYGPLCPQMRCLCGDKEYTCAAKLTQAEGEPVANKLVEAFSLLKDELCTKYASEIEHSKSSSSRKRARPQPCTVEHDYESNFLLSVVPFEEKHVENPYEKWDYPPVPILHDKNRFFVDHLSSHLIRGGTIKDPGMISVINNGGYITSMSIMDDILAVGTQDSDMLLRIDERKSQGPNIIHFWCLKTMKRLFSLYHQGRSVRSLSWITNSRTPKRAGLLCVLSITGSLEIFAIPSHLNDGSFVTFSSFWAAPVGRATVDGAPKGLLSYHVYVWNNELWVLGGMKNGMINVWKIDDRQELDVMMHPGGCFGHPSRTFSITACCWLEAKNGTDKEPLLFATGDLNCMVCIWDRQDTVPLSQTLVPGTGHCYIRELTWTALDITSIYIRHQSVCVWNLNENSIHDIKSKHMEGHGEDIAAGYVVDYDAHLSMGSITIWNHGTVMRGAGGCSGDGRELLQSWTFRNRQPMEKPSIPADSALTLQDVAPLGDNGEAVPAEGQAIIPDISTISKPDEQLVLYRAFIRTLNLIDGLKDANTEYLWRMRFWEHDDMSNKDDARNGEGAVEIFGPGINELVDPVPLTAIVSEARPLKVRKGITLGRFMAVGSAAGLITVTRVLPLPAPPI